MFEKSHQTLPNATIYASAAATERPLRSDRFINVNMQPFQPRLQSKLGSVVFTKPTGGFSTYNLFT